MKIRILGSGTSTGVPQIGCNCAVCQSDNPKDKRLRTSIMVDTDSGTRLLLDCGPDFRQQMLALPFKKIDAVLLSHEHYDHVGGLDDLRPFCSFGEVPIYAESDVVKKITSRMPYCFITETYPGIPDLSLNEVKPYSPFTVADTEIMPIRVIHGFLPIVGYRIGRMAYITDMLEMPELTYDYLQGLDVLVINALRIKPHWTHESLSDALNIISRLKPKKSYLVHMSHDMGLHDDVQNQLPENVSLSYDGLEIEL